MSKATQRQLAFVSQQDPDTGARVTRLTPLEVTCHRTYFYQKCFTNDGQRLLFGGQFGDHWNYHLLDLQSQVATQLSDQAGENTFGGFLSPDDQLPLLRARRAPAGAPGAGGPERRSRLPRAARVGGLWHLGGQQRLHAHGRHRDPCRRLVPLERLAEVPPDVPCQAALPADPHRPGHRRARGDPGAARLARPPAVPAI